MMEYWNIGFFIKENVFLTIIIPLFQYSTIPELSLWDDTVDESSSIALRSHGYISE